jgi:signal transduction histidine kinase
MVNLLWTDGNPEAAIRLEELWNDLASTHSFSLLCTYAMGNFYKAADGHPFEEICRRHGHVIPAEGYTGIDGNETQSREIVRLQQRSRALETELAHRKELEQALRNALAERRRAEADREGLLASEQAARAEAENVNRLKDEFLALLSHELRTPLNAILGWTQIASGRRTDSRTTRRALEVIGRNAALQMHLIDDLLDVSRIVTGKMQISTDPVDLAVVAAAAIDSIRPAAEGKGIDLHVHIDEPMQSVTGDADRLQQVVWNLLSNAVKFTPKEGRVDLWLGRAGSEAQIVVRDTGPGIAPDFLPHVFDRFRQADTTSTRALGGLGLGLSVVRYLVEAHGGTVSAENAGKGHGAIFTVRIPLRPAAGGVVHPVRRTIGT